MVADARALEKKTPLYDVVPEIKRNFRGSFSGYERDHLFYNPDGSVPGFVQAAYLFGLDYDHDGRAAAPIDIDGDGDLDLALLSLQGLRLFENNSVPRHFARIRLTATRTEAQAIGAIVELRAGGVTRRDFVKVTDGFQTQVPLALHFGLGEITEIEELAVHWPSGEVEIWKKLPVDRLLLVGEGVDGVEAKPLAKWPEETRPRGRAVPSPQMQAARLEGKSGHLATVNRPAVINFWAPWCAPCLQELPELARLSQVYASEVDFVGISVETADLESVRALVKRFDLPYAQYLSDENLMERFFGSEGGTTLPSTFVFGKGGLLRRVFRGPIQGPDLRALLGSFREEGLFAADLSVLAIRETRNQNYDKAIEYYRKLAELEPGSAEPLHKMGLAWIALGNLEQARQAFEQAVSRDPDHVEAQFNLGLARLKSGLAAEAVANFQAVVRMLGENHRALLHLGIAAADSRRNEIATAALERAVVANPTSAPTWVIKARLHRRMGQISEARQCYQKSLALDPHNEVAGRELSALPGEIRPAAR